MGRRKIEIKPIAHERNRSVTFMKRKHGLFKKAYELSVLCSVDIAVIIFEERPGHRGKLYQYSSSKAEDIVQRHLRHEGEKESRGPADFLQASSKKYDDVEVEDFDYAPPRTISFPYHIPHYTSSATMGSAVHRQQEQYPNYYPHQRQRERHYYEESSLYNQQSHGSHLHSPSQPQNYHHGYPSHRNTAQYEIQTSASQFARAPQSASHHSPLALSPTQNRQSPRISRVKSISGNGGVYPAKAPYNYRNTDSICYARDRSSTDFACGIDTKGGEELAPSSVMSSGKPGVEWPSRVEQQPREQQVITSDSRRGRVHVSEDAGTQGTPPIVQTTAVGRDTHWLDFLAGAAKSANSGDTAVATRAVSVATLTPGSVNWECGSSSDSRGESSGREEAMAVDGLALFDLQGG